MRDDALKALLQERWGAALARYGARLLKDPADGIARSNRAVALYEAGRWADAAKAFEDVLRREGPASEVAPPALFSLGYCRLELNDGAWGEFTRLCLAHPLRQLLHEDPLTFRAFSKPRGYAGDAPLLDFIYGEEEGWPAPEASEVGKSIYASTTHSAACEAVRARRAFIADLVDRIAEESPYPHLLSIAAGQFRLPVFVHFYSSDATS